jgi:hypothetical protein
VEDHPLILTIKDMEKANDEKEFLIDEYDSKKRNAEIEKILIDEGVILHEYVFC